MQLKLAMQEVLLAKEDQEELLRKRERELTALKGALKEEVAAHDQEVDNMKEQYETEIGRLQKSLEEARQVRFPHHSLVLFNSLPCDEHTLRHMRQGCVFGRAILYVS